MENVQGHADDKTLTIAISGHIDSNNAPALEQAIQDLRNQYPLSKVVLDCQALEYISSAGLRVILRLSQAVEDLKLVNVSSTVYEVLEMTGFTEMLTIEKAYRVLSVDGCEVLGQGSNGKVYRLDPETIIKVYNNPDALPEIHRETELARKAFVKGIPTAIPFDVVKVGSGYGSVFELLNAKSFSELIMADPSQMDAYVSLYIDLLRKIHATDVEPGEMPSIQETAKGWADFVKDYLSPDLGAKLVQLIAAVPDVHKMIHGDYHTKNVMMQNGEVLLIDMDTISYGHPIFEFSSIFLDYVGFGEMHPEDTISFIGIPHELAGPFFNKAMGLYLNTQDPKRIEEVKDKASVIGYTRLLRRTIRRLGKDTPEGKPIADHCLSRLEELLPRIDTLEF